MRDARRPALRVIAVTVLSVGLMGMGGFGGGREAGAPARDFRATFTDRDGARMEANRVTAGGDATLEGDLGRGRLRIPFDNIASVRFEPVASERDRMRADVTLRQGEPITLTVRSAMTFYGQVPGGAYQIRARDLRSVEFGH